MYLKRAPGSKAGAGCDAGLRTKEAKDPPRGVAALTPGKRRRATALDLSGAQSAILMQKGYRTIAGSGAGSSSSRPGPAMIIQGPGCGVSSANRA